MLLLLLLLFISALLKPSLPFEAFLLLSAVLRRALNTLIHCAGSW
jgi:hypothetical protein